MSDDEIAGDCSGDRARSYAGTGAVPIAAPAPAWSRLPLELRERRQWLLAGPDDKGALKVPKSVNAAGELVSGSSTNRATWLTFETAIAWATQLSLGIGYVLAADDPFACIDLDVKDHTTPEQIEWFNSIYEWLDTYTERSQSGRGLHIWCRGKIGDGRKDAGIEVYSQERFIACTGDVLNDCPIRDRHSGILKLVAGFRSQQGVELVELEPHETDEVALARIWNWPVKGEQFRQLWFGRNPDGTPMRDAKGEWNPGPYPSQSEADFALLNLLCLTLRSNAQVRRLFRLSALGRRAKAQKDDRYLNDSLSKLRAGSVVNTPPDIDITAFLKRVAATAPKF